MGIAQSKDNQQSKIQKSNSLMVLNKLSSYALIPTQKQNDHLCKKFSEYLKFDYSLRAYGCLFGSMIGDALGAYCEFQNTVLASKKLDETMKMSGGGVFNLRKGQFTDDTQLAYNLLKGLTKLQPTQNLSSQTDKILIQISRQYIEWGDSRPFDIGITCQKGIQVLKSINPQNITPQQEKEAVRNILKKVNEVNSKSQSNGSLMRIAPMAIFFALLEQNPQTYSEFIKSQISLIHSNEVLKEAGYIWVKVLYDLIVRKDNSPQIYFDIFQRAQKMALNAQIKQWFNNCKQVKKIAATENMGWAKIAWTYGMRLLYNLGQGRLFYNQGQEKQLTFYEQIRQVIYQGGDSDTNAAIVGGLLGAVVGFNNLPSPYINTIFNLQFPNSSGKLTDRPKQYEPLNVLVELLRLNQICQNYKHVHKKKFNAINPVNNIAHL